MFQMLEEQGTSDILGSMENSQLIRESVNLHLKFSFIDTLLSRDFHSVAGVMEVTEGLVEEGDGCNELVLAGAVVPDPLALIALDTSVIVDPSDS